MLREEKDGLGRLVSRECGKMLSEGLGEVQEMIDICDFAVGLSRQLYGLTIATERPGHRMMETWHPLGVVGVISAFNFPVAVWAWNACLAFVCGDSVVWKPSEKTPLVRRRMSPPCSPAPRRASATRRRAWWKSIQGGREAGEALADDARVPLVSATGSTPDGPGARAAGRGALRPLPARAGRQQCDDRRAVGRPRPGAERRSPSPPWARPASAARPCGGCSSTTAIYDALVKRLKHIWSSAAIGDPLDDGVLVGPLIDRGAVDAMQAALDQARAEGGAVHGGEPLHGCYVKPALVEMPAQSAVARQETFAPILYVFSLCEPR